MGNKPNATRELEQHKIDHLFNSGYFAKDNPQSLQRTMWWDLSLHFGFRARDECRKLKRGDIALEKDSDKGECIVLIRERGSKIRNGKENEEKRFYNPTAYATGGDRCAVTFYREFRERRPLESLSGDSPFFCH